MSKQQPIVDQSAETYIRKMKSRNSQSGENLQKLKDIRNDELERLTREAELAQARKTLASVTGDGAASPSMFEQLFKGKTPAEIKEILKDLTPEMIERLRQVALATDNSPASLMLRNQPSGSSGNSRDDMILKLLIDQNSPERFLALIKAVKELSPQPAPMPVVQAQPVNKMSETLELVKIITELNKPFYETLNKKDKELYDAKLEALKANMPGSLEEQINYVKDMAPILGLGSKQTSDLDLRLEEMKENREIDLKRLDWEQRKYEMEQDADTAKWEQITKILQGPVGQAIQSMGSAGAERVRTRGGKQVNLPKAVQTQCPQCQGVIYVDADASTAICGRCGVTLQRTQPAQPEEPTHVDAPQPEEPADEAVEPEQPKEEENAPTGKEEGNEEPDQ